MGSNIFLLIYLTVLVPGSTNHYAAADGHEKADIIVKFDNEIECRTMADVINGVGSGQPAQGTYYKLTKKEMMAACAFDPVNETSVKYHDE